METQAVAVIKGGSSNWLLDSEGKLLEVIGSAAIKNYLSIEGTTAQDPAVSGTLQLAQESPLSAERLLELLGELERRGDAGEDRLRWTSPTRSSWRWPTTAGSGWRSVYDADFGYQAGLPPGGRRGHGCEPNETGTIRMTMSNDSEVRFIPDGG